jgi:anti-anti-sigma factor
VRLLRAMLPVGGHHCGSSPTRDGHQNLTSGIAYAILEEQVPEAVRLRSSAAAGHGAPSPSFACTRKAGACAAWIHLAGDLSRAALPQLEATLREAWLGARLVVLDLRDLTFIDSSGVRAVSDAADHARRDGHALMLVRGPAQIDRVFALTGASAHVSIFDLDPNEPSPALGLV